MWVLWRNKFNLKGTTRRRPAGSAWTVPWRRPGSWQARRQWSRPLWRQGRTGRGLPASRHPWWWWTLCVDTAPCAPGLPLCAESGAHPPPGTDREVTPRLNNTMWSQHSHTLVSHSQGDWTLVVNAVSVLHLVPVLNVPTSALDPAPRLAMSGHLVEKCPNDLALLAWAASLAKAHILEVCAGTGKPSFRISRRKEGRSI